MVKTTDPTAEISAAILRWNDSLPLRNLLPQPPRSPPSRSLLALLPSPSVATSSRRRRLLPPSPPRAPRLPLSAKIPAPAPPRPPPPNLLSPPLQPPPPPAAAAASSPSFHPPQPLPPHASPIPSAASSHSLFPGHALAPPCRLRSPEAKEERGFPDGGTRRQSRWQGDCRCTL